MVVADAANLVKSDKITGGVKAPLLFQVCPVLIINGYVGTKYILNVHYDVFNLHTVFNMKTLHI